jgi:diguanylate cyclase (GGDEF)-like protein/PAS domain S-box-containing protein
MHYIGMAGMRVDASIRYDIGLVALSILVAIGASLAALWLAFSFRRETDAAQVRLMIGSAVLMGAAISGMHYTGMAATEFVATDHPIADSSFHADTSWLGAAAVACGTFIVLGFTLLTALVDRRMAAQSAEAVALRRSEERLRESEARHRAVVDTASEGIVTMDAEGTIESFNRGGESIFGYSAADAIGLSAVLLVPERFRATHLEGIRRCVDTSRELGTRRTVELTGRRQDGSEFPLELSVAAVREATRVFFTTIIRDVTERREAEDRLEFQAHHDPLTGLPNRGLLLNRLEQARRVAARDHGSVAVLMLDLDRFKAINDRLGHAAGNRFLVETSARLGASLRPGDSLARLGGDEFIALLPEADVEEAASVAQRLLAALAAPVVINGHELVGEASIGITVAESRHVDGEAVLREADVAMYAAKASGPVGGL